MGIALGTVQFGLDYGAFNSDGKVKSSEVQSILNFCLNNQIQFLDTALAYGDSEKNLSALNDLSKFKIITKIPSLPEGIDLSHHVQSSVQTSLNNLKIDHIYGVLFHNANDLINTDQNQILWGELLDLKNHGLVKKIGFSAYTSEQVEFIINMFDVDIIQIPMNILDQRMIDNGLLKKLKKKKIEIHARSIFLQGLLLQDFDHLNKFFMPIKQHLEKLKSTCQHNEVSMLQLCLNFIKSITEIDELVVGVQSQKELEEIVNSYQQPFPQVNFSEYKWNGDEKYINPAQWSLK
jgi:aryl-alcohol dehydrogenase-like predicted oxidoreductase